MDLTVLSHAPLKGTTSVPGDKSITHRAIIIASLAEGTSVIKGYLQGLDCLRTRQIMSALGVNIQQDNDSLYIKGVGLKGLKKPTCELDCGNSGTTMRLLTGVLSAQAFSSTLIGDRSLTNRPMNRVILPLRGMGFEIAGDVRGQESYPPLKIDPANKSREIDVMSSLRPAACPRDPVLVSSAQVKSSLLFAALCTNVPILIEEKIKSRDHTERMLQLFGAEIEVHEHRITLQPSTLKAQSVTIPGCLSSAAFFITAASMQPGAHIVIKNVGLNERRMGFIHILKAMGADITIHNPINVDNEPSGDIEVKGKILQGIDVPTQWVASAMDEFPMLFIACAVAQGVSRIHGIQELRTKESDRIQAMVVGLTRLGVKIEAQTDSVIIHGRETFTGGEIDSHDDHRIAMAFLMSAFKTKCPIIVRNCANIATSFPDFIQCAHSLGLEIK